MKQYKVLKEFPSSDGRYVHKEGSEYKPTKSVSRTKNLERLGYIEGIPEQPKTIWGLKEGDKYFVIDCLGVIDQQTWSGSFFDKQSRGMGNIFLACKEAEKELARRRAKVVLLRDTKGFKPDWKSCKFGWSVTYEVMGMDPHFKVDWAEWVDETIRFATEEDAEASIKAHEKEWETYLQIEDGESYGSN